jgi:hypothetical protein
MADGVPPPNIEWVREFNNTLMVVPLMVPGVDIRQQQTTVGRTTNGTITFFFTQPDFAAEYTCRASNLLGTVEEVANLTVHGK